MPSSFIEKILNDRGKIPPLPESLTTIPFIDALWPWMRVARKHLSQITGSQLALLGEDALFAVEACLVKRFSDAVTPSLYLELEIQKLHGQLSGETSSERYQDFIGAFVEGEALRAFFQEYAWLTEHIEMLHSLCAQATKEFLEHLSQDLQFLQVTFNAGKPLGKVIQMQVDAGDMHHGGKCVRILTFESGKKLVYKPKNLEIIKTFNAFLEELNSLGLEPELKSYSALPRGEYGWEEFVEHKNCESMDEVERYFERAGMLLCLLYLFEGKDVHFENIIASGEHPLLIDLESVMHAPTPQFKAYGVEEVFSRSVLSTGLLPLFSYAKEGKKGRDMSGLGVEEEEFNATLYAWKELHTDEMRLDEMKLIIPPSPARVKFRERVIPVHEHVSELVLGFRKMYEFIQANRNALFDQNGWLDKLSACSVRFIFRATRVYFLLLQRLYLPQVIISDEQREEELAILKRQWTELGEEPNQHLLEAEKRALLQGDIPAFQTYPHSKDLWQGTQLVAKDFFTKSANEIIKERLDSMQDGDRKKQELFIKQSLLAKHKSLHLETSKSTHKLSISSEPADDAKILQFVLNIATSLRQAAIAEEDGALGWLGLHPNPLTEQYCFEPIDESLYAGKSGIALFFAALAHHTKDASWKRSALDSLKKLRRDLKNKKITLSFRMGLGGMSGAGSVIYTFFHIGRLLNSPELCDEALSLIDEVSLEEIKKDAVFDIIGGSAGLILVLLSIYKERQNEKVLNLAQICGEHLCEHAQEGAFWKYPSTKKPYLGFGHGTAGIGYALAKLHEVVPEKRFLKIAKAAQNFERNHFCNEENNWPTFPSEKQCWSAWCHGAVGIGLSRLELYHATQDTTLHQELQAALKTTRESLDSANGSFSLCCGTLGRFELLREAAKIMPEFERDVQKGVNLLLNLTDALKNSCDDPGLMKGASGLGYTLLRYLDKENVLPQILLLK